MEQINKKEGAANALLECFAMNDKTRNVEHIKALHGLQEIRDLAWYYAMKYRWDPVLSKAHEEYLTMLNGILKECEHEYQRS